MADTIKPAHHGWDHMPGGEDPIAGLGTSDWVRVHFASTPISCSSGTLTTVTFEEYSIASSSSAFTVGSAASPVNIIEEGFYSLFSVIQWSDAPYTDQRVFRMIPSGTGVIDNSTGGREITGVSSLPVIPSSGDGVHHSWSMWHVNGAGSTPNVHLTFKVWQNTGGAVDLDGCDVTIVRNGPGLGIDDGVTAMADLFQSF